MNARGFCRLLATFIEIKERLDLTRTDIESKLAQMHA
jgi:hypothetical protein